MSAQPWELPIARLEGAFQQIDKRFAELRQDIDQRFSDMGQRFTGLENRLDSIDKRFDAKFDRQTYLILGSWVTLAGMMVALYTRH